MVDMEGCQGEETGMCEVCEMIKTWVRVHMICGRTKG